MGSCYSNQVSEEIIIPTWMKKAVEIVKVLIAKGMTREAYILYDSVTKSIDQIAMSTEEFRYLLNHARNTFKQSINDIDSSTRWCFRIPAYDESVLDQFKCLTEDQYVSMAIYEEHYSQSESTKLNSVESIFGYFISNEETSKHQMIEMLGVETFIYPPWMSSFEQYDLYLKEISICEVKHFGNKAVLNAI